MSLSKGFETETEERGCATAFSKSFSLPHRLHDDFEIEAMKAAADDVPENSKDESEQASSARMGSAEATIIYLALPPPRTAPASALVAAPSPSASAPAFALAGSLPVLLLPLPAWQHAISGPGLDVGQEQNNNPTSAAAHLPPAKKRKRWHHGKDYKRGENKLIEKEMMEALGERVLCSARIQKKGICGELATAVWQPSAGSPLCKNCAHNRKHAQCTLQAMP